jgi:hypothetical protein
MSDLLNHCSGNLSTMLQLARKTNQINKTLQQLNPKLFTENVCLSTIKESVAIFVVDNSAMSFRLKQQKSEIMLELQKCALGYINDIQIKVKKS